MSATVASGLFLAHWSVFYASRATIRNFILNKSAPGYAAAMHELADNARTQLLPDDEVIRTARARLSALDLLCRKYGISLVLLIPPSISVPNDLLASAAYLERVNLEYPFPPGALSTDLFRSDRSHLNEKGAEIFTEAIASRLRARLAEGSTPPRTLAGTTVSRDRR